MASCSTVDYLKSNCRLLCIVSVIFFGLFAVPANAQTNYKFDFGTTANLPVAGYTKVTPAAKMSDNDNVVGHFGFENWDSTAFGAFARGSLNNNVNSDFVYAKPHGPQNVFSTFYFSVNVPEGKYRVTFYIGDPGDTSTTTIKAESHRLLVENMHLAKGQVATRTFTVIRKDPAIAGGGSVGLDKGRESAPVCLNWDAKLTFEFSGARPCIGGLDIVKVDSGITFHLCGNSTIVEQEDPPFACWGQFIHRFYNENIIVNDLGTSGIQSTNFLHQNRLNKMCSIMKPGDFLFFEFGHNEDASTAGMATFKQNMKIFYDSATKHQATMVFVTPTARKADTDPVGSVNGFAQSTRDYAKSLAGSKVVDLNAAVITMKTALATAAYGGVGTAIYAYFPDSPLWPEQKSMSDGTHFCDFGGYELAKWVAQTGMKAGGIDLQKYLLDTTTFDPAKPDMKTLWNVPSSLDTVFRHSSPGARTYSDTSGPAVGVASALLLQPSLNSIAIDHFSSSVTYATNETGKGQFSICSLSGKVIAQKHLDIINKSGSFSWKALNVLPKGMYFIEMRVNDSVVEKFKFSKL